MTKEGSGSEPQRKPKRRQVELDLPPPSADLVDLVIEAGNLDRRDRATVESGLMAIRRQYLWEWGNLDFYASDKQLSKWLTAVKKRAALLAKALDQSSALKYALDLAQPQQASGGLSLEQSQALTAELEDDIAAVGGLHNLASEALELHEKRALAQPNKFLKPSAEKPEDIGLARGILELWTNQLGRAEKGPGAANFMTFAARIIEYVWQRSEVSLDTVADLLERLRAFNARLQ
jgi:hypothetical protein